MRKAVDVVSEGLPKEIVGSIVCPVMLKNLFSVTNKANYIFQYD